MIDPEVYAYLEDYNYPSGWGLDRIKAASCFEEVKDGNN